MKEETKAWLSKGEEDLAAAEWLLKSDTPLTLASAFHIQQAAEKFLKALLVEKGITFEKKHDLPYLLERAEEDTLQSHLGFLEHLSPYAVEFRYPGDFIAPSDQETLHLLEQLKAFRADIAACL